MKRVPIFQPLFLALVIAGGFGILWAIVVTWGVGIVEGVARSGTVYENIYVEIEGTPVIESYSRGDYLNATHRTLDGQPLPAFRRGSWLEGAYLEGKRQRHGRFFGLPWAQRVMTFEDGGRPATFWHLVHDGELHGTGYFVGYDSRAKLLVGYIGSKGFRTSKPPQEELFCIDGRAMSRRGIVGGESYYYYDSPYLFDYARAGLISGWVVYLVSEDRLWEVDLRQRSVRVVFQSEGMLAVGELSPALPPGALKDPTKRPKRRNYLAVRTVDQLCIVDPRGGEHHRYAIPAELPDRWFTLYQMSDQKALVHVSRRSGQGTSKHTLFWLDERGEVDRRKEVTLGSECLFDDPRIAAGTVALAVPAPAVVVPMNTLGAALAYASREEEADFSTAMAWAWSVSWPALLLAAVLAVVLAWLCYRRHTQYGLSGSWVWAVFVFLFGVPGLVGYLFCRRWPVREACPACGRPAPRDRESCFACGQQFPQPARKGTEVLV